MINLKKIKGVIYIDQYLKLVNDLKLGTSKLYLEKGDLNISLEIIKAIPICIPDAADDGGNSIKQAGISLILAENNRVDIYVDEIVRKVKKPSNVINDFKFCYKVCATDNDKSFYIGQMA